MSSFFPYIYVHLVMRNNHLIYQEINSILAVFPILDDCQNELWMIMLLCMVAKMFPVSFWTQGALMVLVLGVHRKCQTTVPSSGSNLVTVPSSEVV